MLVSISEAIISSKVLTICCIRNTHLLIGEGCNISLFDTKSGTYKSKIRLFSTANVHGIKKGKHYKDSLLILVWGQKSFIILSLNLIEFNWESKSKEYQIDDWIVDGTISRDLSLILLTAHNVVVQLSLVLILSNKDYLDSEKCAKLKSHSNIPVLCPKQYILDKRKCSEDSLLYCGNIVKGSWDPCIILAGTVFGYVHFWVPNSLPNSNYSVTPIESLKCSKGAIFSIYYNEYNNLLAVTSDDRSVRVWRFDCIPDDGPLFESNSQNVATRKKIRLESIFCSFGHTSRVWRALILDDETVVSCGEDSSVCHWQKDGSLCTSWKAHKTTIWSMAFSDDILYTGANDGSVKRWKILNDTTTSVRKIFFSDKIYADKNDLDKLNKAKCKTIQDVELNHFSKNELLSNCNVIDSLSSSLRSISLISSSIILVVCDNGCVFIYNFYDEVWRMVFSHALLRHYCVTDIDDLCAFICFGTLSGTLIFLKIETWQCIGEQKISPGKIQSLMFIGSYIVTCSADGDIQVHSYSVNENNTVDLGLCGNFVLPPCRQRWINAAAFPADDFADSASPLLVGDATGNLFAYTKSNRDPVSALKILHGRNGVTSLVVRDGLVVTTGRDGHLRYSVYSEGALRLVHSRALGVGSWISKIVRIERVLLAVAFIGNKLCLYDINEERVVTEVECGGGHRSWDMLIGKVRMRNSGQLTHVDASGRLELVCGFLKDGVPMLWRTSLSDRMLPPLKVSTSGREIHCLEPLSLVDGSLMILFGGEDTLLHSNLVENGQLVPVGNFKSHLSSIKCVRKIVDFCERDPSLGDIYLFSCGGRAEMKVWRVSCYWRQSDGYFQTPRCSKSVCDGTLVNVVASHMLKPGADRRKTRDFDPETRYMDSLAFWISSDKAVFILASSDGYLRIFEFDKHQSDFLIIGEVNCGFCLIGLARLKLEQDYVVASDTRGSIFIWNMTAILSKLISSSDHTLKNDLDLEPVEFAVQRSGLNALNCYSEKAENGGFKCKLAIGGDDGSLHLLEIEEDSSYCRFNKLNLRILCLDKKTFHASQVSGVVWLDSSKICSASVDQRIIVWKVDKCTLNPGFVYFSSIPDVHGISLVDKNQNCYEVEEDDNDTFNIFLFGNGIQMLKIKNV